MVRDETTWGKMRMECGGGGATGDRQCPKASGQHLDMGGGERAADSWALAAVPRSLTVQFNSNQNSNGSK
jgi:hypothetical protein